MKRAVILHGTDGHAHAQWFPWLKGQLEARGYAVWVPDLPDSAHPDAKRWTTYLLSHNWDFHNSLIVGHSAGAVEILQLAQALPEGVVLKAAVLCAAFNEHLYEEPRWRKLKPMFEPVLDFAAIARHAKRWVFVHAKNDPWCPVVQSQDLAQRVGGEYILLPQGQHFTVALDPAFKTFPALAKVLEEHRLW